MPFAFLRRGGDTKQAKDLKIDEAVKPILCQMEPLLTELNNCPPETRETLKNLPDRGVYVFYQGRKAFYVGRSNQIHERVRTHGRNGASQEQASFAFRLLEKEFNLQVGHGASRNRAQIANEYAEAFREQKLRVRNMQVQAVEILDDAVAYFFEAYAIIALGTTEYNKFEPH